LAVVGVFSGVFSSSFKPGGYLSEGHPVDCRERGENQVKGFQLRQGTFCITCTCFGLDFSKLAGSTVQVTLWGSVYLAPALAMPLTPLLAVLLLQGVGGEAT